MGITNNTLDKTIFSIFTILLITTITVGLVMFNVRASADPVSSTSSATASVNVSAACTMSSSIATGEEHTKTINAGTFTGDIGLTTISTICNDAGGYAIYAIGYSNDTYGTTNLINTADSSIVIPTGTARSGDTSNWSMKLTAIGTSEQSTTPTIVGGDGVYTAVPSTYAKVAYLPNSTMDPDDPTTSSATSSLTTTYGVYAHPAQAAGTYNGKVRYTLVHPNNAIPKNKYYMQDFTIGMCETLAHSSPITVYDKRDEEPYLVQYLKDGNCWMLDNLRLGSNDHEIPLSPLDTNIKEPWTLPQGITEGFTGYTEAHINAAYKNTQLDEQYRYGLGSGKIGTYYNYCAVSGGTYCYAKGDGVDIPNTDIDSPYDVCPVGWRMPTGGATGEYQMLCDDYYGASCVESTPMDATNVDSLQYGLSLPLSGRFYGDEQRSVGAYGGIWSSTYLSGNAMFRPGITASIVTPTNFNDRYDGRTIRCLAKNQ